MGSSSKKKPNRLRKAIERWVLADYMFRSGPACFSPETQAELLAAEDELRFVCSRGKTSDPIETAELLGMNHALDMAIRYKNRPMPKEVQETVRKSRKKKPTRKTTPSFKSPQKRNQTPKKGRRGFFS